MSGEDSRSDEFRNKILSADAPEPPEDLVIGWTPEDYNSYYDWLVCRPYNMWSPADLRMIAIIVFNERMVRDAANDIAARGLTQVNSAGNLVTNPSVKIKKDAVGEIIGITRRLGLMREGDKNRARNGKSANLALEAYHVNKDKKKDRRAALLA